MPITLRPTIAVLHHKLGTVNVHSFTPGNAPVTHLRPEHCDPGDPDACDFTVYCYHTGAPLALTSAEEDLVADWVCAEMHRRLLDEERRYAY